MASGFRFEKKDVEILIVEDSPTQALKLEHLLLEQGYRTLVASNGREALDIVHRQMPALIISDILMPEMDGYELCLNLKNDPKTRLIPVVLITSLSDIDDKIKAIEVGADDFISKPFNQYEVLARSKSLLKMKHFTDELEHAETVIESMALTVEAKDPYTEGHCDRLSMYAVRLGKRIGLADDDIKALNWGGILHDLGKVGISESILLKPGKLSDEEFAIMKEHTFIGDRICKPLKSMKLVVPIIRHHHERYDGSGYPDRLRGEEIAITARILSIVDVYDALRTERPYKPAFSMSKSLRILTEDTKKGWWDTYLVESFIDMIRKEGESQNETFMKNRNLKSEMFE